MDLKRCASLSSSGLPVDSGLKCDQFNWGTGAGWIGCVGGMISCVGGAGSCKGGTGGTTGGTTEGGWGTGGSPSMMSDYIAECGINESNTIPNSDLIF